MEYKPYFEIIANVLELPEDFKLTAETKISEIPGWDSLAWVQIIAGIEGINNKEFPFENIEEIETLDDLIRAS